jgi:hypothetical protein
MKDDGVSLLHDDERVKEDGMLRLEDEDPLRQDKDYAFRVLCNLEDWRFGRWMPARFAGQSAELHQVHFFG